MAEDILYDEEQPGGDPEPLRKLYDVVSSKGLYTKSYDDFKIKYSKPEERDRLFNVVSQEGLFTKSKEDFNGKYFSGVSAVPKFELQTKPGKESAIKESTGIRPTEVSLRQAQELKNIKTSAHKFSEQVAESKKVLENELKANDDVVEKTIREGRYLQAKEQGLTQFANASRSDMPQTQAQIDAQRLIAPEVKPQDIPVTPQDLAMKRQGIEANELEARQHIANTAKFKPEKKAAIEKAAYLADKSTEIERSPDSPRVNKFLNNASKIGKEYSYDVKSGQLVRPEGFLDSIITGIKERTKQLGGYNDVKNMTDEQAANFFDKKNAAIDPDEARPVPTGAGEIGQMLGMEWAPLVKGGGAAIVSTFAGNPEAAPFVNAAINAPEYYKRGYYSAFEQTYNQLKAEGMPREEAIRVARAQAETEGKLSAVEGAVSSIIGSRIGLKPLPKFNLTGGFKKAITNVLAKTAHYGGEAALEGTADGLVAGYLQEQKNIAAKERGIFRTEGEGILENIKGELTFSLAMAGVTGAGKAAVDPNTYKTLLYNLTKQPEAAIDTKLGEWIQEGRITEEDAKNTKSAIQEEKRIQAQIPEDVTEESREKIREKIDKRNELQGKVEQLDEAFKPELKEKINKVNEEIVELSKEKEKPTEEKKLIKKAIKEGRIPDVYSQIAKDNPGSFYKFVADQALGRTDTGEMSAEPPAEYAVREQFGDDIVNKAIELYPLTQKTEQDAQTIRSDKGEIPKGGEITEGGQNQGGENIQPYEVNAPINAETEQQAGEEEVVINTPDDFERELTKALDVESQSQPESILEASPQVVEQKPEKAKANATKPKKEKPVFTKKEQEQADYAYQNTYRFFKQKYPDIDVDEYNRLRSIKRNQQYPKHSFEEPDDNTMAPIPDNSTIRDVLEHIAKNSNKFSQLAEYLLKRANNYGLTTEIKQTTDKNKKASSYWTSGRIEVAPLHMRNPRIVLHEIIHALTDKMDRIYPDYTGAAYLKKLKEIKSKKTTQEALVNVYLDAAKALKQYDILFGENGTANNYSSDAVMKREVIYGMLNIDEFLAEALTNGKFQEQLRKIPSSGKNMWQRFVYAISKLLGVPIKINLLDEVLSISDIIIHADSALPKLGEINQANNRRDRNEDTTQYTPQSIIQKAKEFYKNDPLINRVMSFLEPIIKANPNIKIDTGFKWDSPQYEGQKITNEALGYSFPSGNIILNFDSMSDYDTLYRTALHELVHAATRNEINTNKAFNEDLKKVLADVRRAMKLPEGDSVADALIRNKVISEDYDGKYGAANEHELLAEVFTNQKFYEFLKGLEYKGDNLLHRLFLAIAKFFSQKYKALATAKGSTSVDNIADYLMGLTESVVSDQQTRADGNALALNKSKGGTRVVFRGEDITDALEKANINPNIFERILSRGNSQFRNAIGELRGSLLSSLNAGIEYWTKAISEKSILNKEGDISSVKLNLVNKYQKRLDSLKKLKTAIEGDLLSPNDIVLENNANQEGDALPLMRPKEREVLKNVIAKAQGKISDTDIRGKLKQIAGLTDEEIDELLAEVVPPEPKAPSEKVLTDDEIGLTPEEPKRKSALRRFREKYFDRAKGMPDWILKLKDRAKGTAHLEVRQALQLVEKTKATAKQIGFDDWELFDKALRGQYYGSDLSDLKALPPTMQVLAVQMRNKIDGLSRDLIINNYVTPEQALNIESNIGEYMTRSYRAFNEKDWSRKVPTKAREDAYRLLVQQRFDELYDPEDQEADIDSIIEMAKADAFRDLQSIIDGISDKYTPPKISVQKGKDLGVLKQRQDIPKEIREVLGEYTDPGVNFAMTVSRIAALKSSAEYLTSIKREGLGEIFFEADSRPPEASVEIKSEGSETWNPLNGLYTTPEVKAVFDETEVIRNKWVQLWLKGVGAIKWGKTVGSLVTQVKNFESNLGFAIMNGHYRASKSGESFKFLKDKLFGGEKSQDQMIEKVIRLGIVDQSIGVRELKDMFATDSLDKVIVGSTIQEKSPLKKLGNTLVGKPIKFLNKVYGASDDFWKVYGFLNEAESLSKATYNKSYKELTDEEQSMVDVEASERVKNVYPTYDRVWEGAKSLSKGLPIFGNFLSFQAESIRVLLNTFGYAINDLKEPGRKLMGAQRLAGIGAYLGARTMILYTISQMTGVGMAGLLGAASDDDEDQKLKDINRFSPDFIRSGDKLAMDHGEGNYTVYDVGSLEPYGVWFKTMNAFNEGNDIVKNGGMGASVTELLSPFMEPEMSFKMGLNLYNNENDFGGRIYNPMDGLGDQAMDAMAFIVKKAKPSTIDLIQRIYKKEDKTNEISAIFGGRGYDVDIQKSFSFKLKAAEELFDANRDAVNKVKYSPGSTQEEIDEAQRMFEERTNKVIKMLAEDYQAAIRLGTKIEKLDEVLDRKKFFQGYNKDVKNQIKSGVVEEEKQSSGEIKEWE